MATQISAQSVMNETDRQNAIAAQYIEDGKYKEAEKLLMQLNSVQRAKSDTLSAGYATTLHHLANLYTSKGEYQKSDSLYRKAIELKLKIYGENSIEYARVLIDLSDLHNSTQNYEGMDENLDNALNIIENKLGKKSLEYANGLCQFGIYYTYSQQFDKALGFLEEAEKIYRDLLGDNHIKYAKVATSFGTYYLYREKYELSTHYYSKAKDIFKSSENKNHPDYLDCLLAKTTVDLTLEKFEEAESALLEGMDIVKTYYGETHPHYAAALSNLSYVYYVKEDFQKAEQTLKESLRISNMIFGKMHSFYFNAINLLAETYVNIGAYEVAEPLYVESLNLRKKLYGDNHKSVFNAINNMAGFYAMMENYGKAEQMIDEMLVKLKMLNMEDLIVYADLMVQKSSLLKSDDKTVEPMQLLEKAIDIYRIKLGEEHPKYISLLAKILSEKIKCFPQYGPLDIKQSWLNIIAKWEKAGYSNNLGYGIAVNNLATYYITNRQFDEAQSLLIDNMDALVDRYGEDSEAFQMSVWNFAFCEEIAGNTDSALQFYEYYFLLRRFQIQRFFAFMSDRERELYLESYRNKLNDFHSVYQHKDYNTAYAGLAFNCELLSKSLLLNSLSHFKQTINNSDDDMLKEDWSELKSLKNSLFRLEMKEQNTENIALKEKIEEQADVLEKKILKAPEEYNYTLKDFYIDRHDVQKELSGDEAVIEYINFKIDSEDSKLSGDTIYGAFFLTATDIRLVNNLCSADKLRTVIQKSQNENDYSGLYTLIWQPLEEFMKEKTNIYIAPSDLLHEIPFICINRDNKKNTHNILSSKDIPDIKARLYQSTSLKCALFGGVDYTMTDTGLLESEPEPDNVATALTRSIINDSDLTRGQGFSYLWGTKKEVQTIESILKPLGWEVDLYMDKHATKSRFQSYSSSSPDVIHISTHGFYYPKKAANKKSNKDDNPYKMSDNPLIRSGLAFAGANSVWNQKEKTEHTENGILTAYEISNMDLSNTKLVVLSACKTGLGDIISHEGIYGLQRAFRQAGVKSMIVSLWDIADDVALEFMTVFYSSWKGFDRRSIRNAFLQAQNMLKQKYGQSPEKWGGFVLIE